jgi:hypothetical protein
MAMTTAAPPGNWASSARVVIPKEGLLRPDVGGETHAAAWRVAATDGSGIAFAAGEKVARGSEGFIAGKLAVRSLLDDETFCQVQAKCCVVADKYLRPQLSAICSDGVLQEGSPNSFATHPGLDVQPREFSVSEGGKSLDLVVDLRNDQLTIE